MTARATINQATPAPQGIWSTGPEIVTWGGPYCDAAVLDVFALALLQNRIDAALAYVAAVEQMGDVVDLPEWLTLQVLDP